MAATSQVMKATERQLEIAEMYLKGKRQSEIAQSLGTSQATISRNLQAVREAWLNSALVDFNEAMARELAKTDNLERVYWESWERSLLPFRSKSTKVKPDGTEHNRKVEQRVGNPQFLQGVQWCIEKRCKLLGLDAPERLKLSWEDSLPDGVTPGEVTRQFSELMRIASQNGTNSS